MILKAPMPWFGGKSRIAAEVWKRFGDVPNLVDPFCGSLAILLARPHEPKIETVSDLDGFISNFWRALAADPEALAHHADWPVNENDLHARHSWLVGQGDSMQAKLEGDPDWYDAKIAGWWVWGICCWIGSGFCSGEGPWHVVDGLLVKVKSDAGLGVNRQLPHLSGAGQGVNRKRLQLGGVYSPAKGAANKTGVELLEWLQALSDRLRRVRVCCGDWTRVMGPSVTFKNGLTAVFLDPPYSAEAGRDNDLYRVESATVAHDVRAWALENGSNPLLRIALCGYIYEHGEHMPDDWECLEWKTAGGYASQGDVSNDNGTAERVWFSPHCLKVEKQADLFECVTTGGSSDADS